MARAPRPAGLRTGKVPGTDIPAEIQATAQREATPELRAEARPTRAPAAADRWAIATFHPTPQDALSIRHVQTIFKSGKLEVRQQDLQARGRPSAPGQPSRGRKAGGDLESRRPPLVLCHNCMFTHTPRGHGRAPAAELDSGQVLSHDSVSTLRAKSKSKPQVQRGRCSPPPPRETSGSVSAQRGPGSRCPPLVPSESPSRRTSWATTDPSDTGARSGSVPSQRGPRVSQPGAVHPPC